MKTLYLGMGDPSWTARAEFEGIPRCVSANQLDEYKTLPESNGATFIDSGAFTILKKYGRWLITPEQFVAKTRRQVEALGRDKVVAIGPMDRMCEPIVIYGGRSKDGTFAGTRQFLGLPDATFDDCVLEHQRQTVANFQELERLAPDLPIIPVIQGYTLTQYLRCVAMYLAAGIDLTTYPLVGIGSVCRRQGTKEAKQIISALHALGIRIHGFGVSAEGVKTYGGLLLSADSQAWCYGARRRGGLCIHQVPRKDGRGFIKWETNCPVWALAWYHAVLAGLGNSQPALDVIDPAADLGRPVIARTPAGRTRRSRDADPVTLALFDAA